jgi:plasmid stabilization system protein ParE
MQYKIVLSTLAKNEIQKSYDWYEEQTLGLGNYFIETVDGAIKSILLNPEAYPKRNRYHREMVVYRFPFLIVYQIKKDNIINILHVFHTSRNPKLKYKGK